MSGEIEGMGDGGQQETVADMIGDITREMYADDVERDLSDDGVELEEAGGTELHVDDDGDIVHEADGDAEAVEKSTKRFWDAIIPEDLEGLTPDQLEALQFKYTQNGEEVTRGLKDVIRDAQRLGGVDKLKRQRDEVTGKLTQAQSELERLRAVERTFAQALRDDEVLKQVREAVGKQTGQQLGGQQQQQVNANQPDPRVQAAQSALENVVRPYLHAVAEAYEADPTDLEEALMDMASRENPMFFGPQELEALVNEQLIGELESKGYNRVKDIEPFDHRSLLQPQGSSMKPRGIKPKVDPSVRVAELEAELAALKGIDDAPGGGTTRAIGQQGSTKKKSNEKTVKRDRDGNINLDDVDSFSDIMSTLHQLQ